MQKWEYCVVGPFKGANRGLETHHPYIGSFTDDGFVETSLKGKPELKRVASAIAKLGNEGWEMSGCGRANENPACHFLYFKRPIE